MVIIYKFKPPEVKTPSISLLSSLLQPTSVLIDAHLHFPPDYRGECREADAG